MSRAGRAIATAVACLLLVAVGCEGRHDAERASSGAAPVATVDPKTPPAALPAEPFPESYRDFPKRPAGTLTFSRDIAPLIYRHCGECHRPRGAAPFSLLTYADVSKRNTEIATVTKMRFMPPWLPERGYGEFQGERGLTVEQVGLLQQWIFEGAPEGDPVDLPPMPEWPEGWELGPPDLIVRLPEAYELRADPPDVFRNFVAADLVEQDRYVRGYQFRPKNPQVVHHATVELDRTRGSRRLDAEDPGPGFLGMHAEATNPPDGHFVGWVPGRGPSLTPESMSWRLGRDTDLVLQLHMLPSGKRERVDPELGLYFADGPPSKVPLMIRLGSRSLDIPAGEPEYVSEETYTLPVDVHVHTIVPHAHYLGKDMKAFATLPDGTRRWLLWIRDWDFNWQDEYRYREPVLLPRGTVLAMRFTFDNSASNIRNPHNPPQRVKYGPSTYDEMGDLWLQVLPARPHEAEVLRSHYGLFELQRGVATARILVAQDPESPQNRDRLGNRLMNAGQIDEAIVAFRECVRLDPTYVHGLRNLGTALYNRGAHREALVHLEQVVQLDPGDVEGHLNLGYVLASTGQFDRGIEHLRRALELRPEDPKPRFHLARALELTGRAAEALEQYRLTAEAEPSWSPPLNAAAWLAATHPEVADPESAVRYAERSAELTGYKDPVALEALSVAYASAARFRDAIQSAERALALLPPGDRGPRRQRLADALRHYRGGMPYRPPAASGGA